VLKGVGIGPGGQDSVRSAGCYLFLGWSPLGLSCAVLNEEILNTILFHREVRKLCIRDRAISYGTAR